MNDRQMHGPYPLTISTIEKQLGKVISAGILIFGDYWTDGKWTIRKIDRSDEHVRARLWANVSDFPYFCYQLCDSAEDAYLLHCALFHQHNPRRGTHPVPPAGSQVACPVCAVAPVAAQGDVA